MAKGGVHFSVTTALLQRLLPALQEYRLVGEEVQWACAGVGPNSCTVLTKTNSNIYSALLGKSGSKLDVVLH